MLNSELILSQRKKLGYRQQELAELIGVNKSTICCYEKGTRMPNLDGIARLCVALKLMPNDLIIIEDGADYKK